MPGDEAGEAETWIELAGTVPDGVAVAADGSLVVARYRPDALLHVDLAWHVRTLGEDPYGQTLGGPGERRTRRSGPRARGDVQISAGGTSRWATSRFGGSRSGARRSSVRVRS